jgi:hypothetical protein
MGKVSKKECRSALLEKYSVKRWLGSLSRAGRIILKLLLNNQVKMLNIGFS